jgi:hypothetical protein
MNEKSGSQIQEIQSHGVTDAGLLEEYLESLDSKKLKELWKTKKIQEKMNKRQQSQIMRNRYKNEEEFIKALEDTLHTCKSLTHAAKTLNVTKMTLLKWGKLYFPDLVVAARGHGGGGEKKDPWSIRCKYPLREVLDGKHPNYSINRLRERLIYHEILPFRCSQCGFDEERMMNDDKNSSHRKHARKPILLDFLDSNPHNHLLSNLRLLCYNCYFLMVGNLAGAKNKLKANIKKAKIKYTPEEIEVHLKWVAEKLKAEQIEKEKHDDNVKGTIDATDTK